MCLTPIVVNNAHFKHPSLKHVPELSNIKDVSSSKLYVPCGHCPSCLALKQEYFIQRVQMESLSNDLWTGMLSYNNEHLPTLVLNGYKHKYADTRDVQLLTKRLRNLKVLPPFKYWFISERGKKHRPHWHFIISTSKDDKETLASKLSREDTYKWHILDQWYTNKGSRRVPIKSPNLTYVCKNGKYNYDFHYVNPSLSKNGESDLGFYVSKYYLKGDDYTKRLRSALRLNIEDDKTFNYYWSLLRHKVLSSHYLGDYRDEQVSEYIKMCISFSHQVQSFYPLFINPLSSKTFPLCPYYRDKFLSDSDIIKFRSRNPNLVNGVIMTPEFNMDEFVRSNVRFEKILKRIDLRDIDYQSFINNDFTDYGNITENFQLADNEACMGQSPSDFDNSDFFYDSLF